MSKIFSLIRQPIKNAYSTSQLCVLVPFLNPEHSEKLLWDCYWELKKIHPDQKYHNGPLIGLHLSKQLEPLYYL